MPDAESFTAEQIEAIQRDVSIRAQLLTWMAVHGACVLVLRHRGVQGATRSLIEGFARGLGSVLVDQGCLTAEQLARAAHIESERPGRLDS
jgi:hypothetical protein